MTREDEIVAFIEEHGPQWKQELIRSHRRGVKRDTFLDRPLRKAREKGRLATMPHPPRGPFVLYYLLGQEGLALIRWYSKVDYPPHGVYMKGVEVIGVERRVVPSLNEDIYYALLVESVGTKPIQSARPVIEVADGTSIIHRQSGLWDFDDCMPPNPVELPLAIGEVRGIDLFRVTSDKCLIRFPAQQPQSKPGDWKYTEHPFNRGYMVVATLFFDDQRAKLYSKTVGDIMKNAKILTRNGKVTTTSGIPTLESGTKAIVMGFSINHESRRGSLLSLTAERYHYACRSIVDSRYVFASFKSR